MPERRKRVVLIICLIVLLAMLGVSAALPGLQLQPGTPFPGANTQEENQVPSIFQSVIRSDGFTNAIISGILGVSVLAFLFYFLANFLLHSDIRRYLRNLLLLVLLIGLIIIIPRASINQPISEAGNETHSTLAPAGTYPVSPIGEPPETFLWIVFVILITAVLAFSLWILFRRRNNRPEQDKIVQQAQAAVASLQMGEDFRSVILHCYLEMTRILRDEQGIERDADLTAREFMEFLQARGLSSMPIHDLTFLFESARYSPLRPSKSDEQLGLDCLQRIVQESQRRRR